MKLRTLSAIACGAVLGLGLLSGCGSSNSSGATTGTTLVGVDGYVVDLNGSPVTAFCSDTNTTYTTTNLVNVRGAIKFAETLNANCTVTIPANVRIDAGLADKPLGFAMRGRGLDGRMVSHLTTLAIAQNNPTLLSLVEDFNPVTAITDATSDNNATKNKAQKLLVLGEAVKTVLAAGTITDVTNLVVPVADLNNSAKTVTDINASAISANLAGALQTAVENKADAMKALITVLPALKTAGVNIEDAVINISDGGKTLAESVGDKNITSIDTSAVTTAISNATTAASSLPAKLSVGSIKIGTQTVSLNGNSFSATVDTVNKDVADFYNVSFPSVTLTKGFTEQTVGLNVTISDANANQVSMSIAGAKLTPNDTNTSVRITLPTSSTITVAQTGLPALQAVIGTSASANPSSQLVMNDLAFDIDTLLGSINSSSIPAAIDALNGYIQKSGVYDVNISFSGLNSNLTTDYTSFAGKVTVKGDVTAPTAPTLGAVTASSLVVTAEAGSTIAIKNGSTTLATATATGSAQTITFTALTASATLNVTATDRYGNISTAATKAFTYTAPDSTAPAAPTLGDVNATSLVVTAEIGSTITIKNGTTTIATATATGSAQTITFTALTANATLNVTATDAANNVSTVATKTYTAPSGLTDAFATSHATQAKSNTGANVQTVVGNYTVKVFASTTPVTETSNGTLAIYGTINGTNTAAALQLNDSYATGTTFVVKVYNTASGSLVAISSSALAKSSAIDFGALSAN